MPRSILLLSLAMAGVAQAQTIEELLPRIGESERRRAEQPACRFTEVTTISELDETGRVRGSETSTYEVVRGGTTPMARTQVKTETSGEALNGLLRRQTGDRSGKRPLSALHPENHGAYRFRLEGVADGRATIAFEPLTPSADRTQGRAIADVATGRLVALHARPSKLPFVLDSLAMRFEFTDTPCGNVATVVRSEGVGGVAFYKVRFRAESRFSAHRPVD